MAATNIRVPLGKGCYTNKGEVKSLAEKKLRDYIKDPEVGVIVVS